MAKSAFDALCDVSLLFVPNAPLPRVEDKAEVVSQSRGGKVKAKVLLRVYKGWSSHNMKAPT